MDKNGGRYLVWSDGTSYAVDELAWKQQRNEKYTLLNAVSVSDIFEKKWDLTSSSDVHKLLQVLTPGDWPRAHATKLCDQMLGGRQFKLFLVPTEVSEVEALIRHLDVKFLATVKGIDPFAGSRTINKELRKRGINLFSNEVNKYFPANFHCNALDPASYSPKLLRQFQYCVTSIPFAFADLAVPLLTLVYEAVFLHLPSWYLFQGSRHRHQWLTELISQRRIIILNTCQQRNQAFGKYAIWMCVFKTRDLAHRYLKNANAYFERSLPCFFGALGQSTSLERESRVSEL